MNVLASTVGHELKLALRQLYGPRFSDLILFGSYARNTFHDESDVDFAVVLQDDAFSASAEILRITPFSTEIGIRHHVAVSILPVSSNKLRQSAFPVYQAIRTEGIRI
ncbi:nucleotidyltransferase domain-containing protein [uncultured Spirosoma sp.]|uniref:nucleotidyltransferase domain-containing protein n=1 Tax=uncultured Spirosoma sp. TaxID=278208 RepID=UPI0025907BFE|nr:nucleotidyltransferase domain-containing protein [uncultured Spirosoma sp.]